MTVRDLSESDFAGLEHAHRQRVQERRLSQLEDQEAAMPCSSPKDFFLTWGSVAPVLVVVAIVVAFVRWG